MPDSYAHIDTTMATSPIGRMSRMLRNAGAGAFSASGQHGTEARVGRHWIFSLLAGFLCLVALTAATRGDDGGGVTFAPEDRAYWAFQPIRRPAVPHLPAGERADNAIDAFVVERLSHSELQLGAEADRRTLLRRVTFDLHGLPPTPEEIAAFLADTQPGAYGRVVERLLSAPRYGEQWGRLWLDLVRYADSNGFKSDETRPNAWRYRDYVIRSLNDDKPYDRFVAEQLAGDEIAPNDLDALVATGFLRHWPYESNQRDVPLQRSQILNDITDVTGQVFLGLTVGCARCHDHKFDPILQRDYYRLQAFFVAMQPYDDVPLEVPARTAAHDRQMDAWRQATEEIRRAMEVIEAPYRQRLQNEVRSKFPPETQALLDRPAAQYTPYQRQIVALTQKQIASVSGAQMRGKMKPNERQRWDELQRQMTTFRSRRPPTLSMAMAVREAHALVPATTIPGTVGDDGGLTTVEPGFLSLLEPGSAAIESPGNSQGSSGRRAALARWVTSADNPLTARVIVNRLWHQHFRRGLVASPSDFGRQGGEPSHPAALDWLASEFIARGWRLKELHRLMVTSRTYRQQSYLDASPDAQAADPENALLWRMRPRRLDAEEIRDAMLAVSGELNFKGGGPGDFPELPEDLESNYRWEPTGAPYREHRRSIYLFVRRNLRVPLLEAFDVPDTHESCACRSVTTTAPQALLLLNSDWVLARAAAFANRLESTPEENRLDHAYQLAFARGPHEAEIDAAQSFLADATAAQVAGPSQPTLKKSAETPATATRQAWVDLCHVLLNSNEFLYID